MNIKPNSSSITCMTGQILINNPFVMNEFNNYKAVTYFDRIDWSNNAKVTKDLKFIESEAKRISDEIEVIRNNLKDYLLLKQLELTSIVEKTLSS